MFCAAPGVVLFDRETESVCAQEMCGIWDNIIIRDQIYKKKILRLAREREREREPVLDPLEPKFEILQLAHLKKKKLRE
jgi:hypothetical protein